jgi:hypothetical protein
MFTSSFLIWTNKTELAHRCYSKSLLRKRLCRVQRGLARVGVWLCTNEAMVWWLCRPPDGPYKRRAFARACYGGLQRWTSHRRRARDSPPCIHGRNGSGGKRLAQRSWANRAVLGVAGMSCRAHGEARWRYAWAPVLVSSQTMCFGVRVSVLLALRHNDCTPTERTTAVCKQRVQQRLGRACACSFKRRHARAHGRVCSGWLW